MNQASKSLPDRTKGQRSRHRLFSFQHSAGHLLLNSSGTQFANSTAPRSASGIFGNTLDQNAQGGILLADVNLSTFDLTLLGSDLSTKGIPLTSRGPLAATISGNTITNNGNGTTLNDLTDELQSQTLRDDAFGVYVAAVTGSSMAITLDRNLLQSNGLPQSIQTDSTGGIGILTGGTSRITAFIEDSTFLTNRGADIHGIVGDGPATSDSARLDINIDRNRLTNTQPGLTEDGTLAAGIRLVADTGTLNTAINSNVIEGDSAVLASILNSSSLNMDAIYSIAQGDAMVTTMLGVNGDNVLGGSGNEIRNWHVGVGFNAEDTSQGTLSIRDALIDAHCLLKLHAGEDLDLTATSVFNATITDSTLLARLPSASGPVVDAIFIDALGASQANLTIANSTTEFVSMVPAFVRDGQWLGTTASDDGILTVSIDNLSALNPHTGFRDFIELEAEDDSRINFNLSDTTVGETSEFGVDAFATDSARIVQNIINSTFNGNGLGLINGEAEVNSTMSSTVTESSFTTTGQMAIQFAGNSSLPPRSIRLGATLDSNTFMASPASVDILGIATRGSTQTRVNMINNTANGSYLLSQLATPPATSTFELFDAGNNTPSITRIGTITDSPTVLDITFP